MNEIIKDLAARLGLDPNRFTIQDEALAKTIADGIKAADEVSDSLFNQFTNSKESTMITHKDCHADSYVGTKRQQPCQKDDVVEFAMPDGQVHGLCGTHRKQVKDGKNVVLHHDAIRVANPNPVAVVTDGDTTTYVNVNNKEEFTQMTTNEKLRLSIRKALSYIDGVFTVMLGTEHKEMTPEEFKAYAKGLLSDEIIAVVAHTGTSRVYVVDKNKAVATSGVRMVPVNNNEEKKNMSNWKPAIHPGVCDKCRNNIKLPAEELFCQRKPSGNGYKLACKTHAFDSAPEPEVKETKVTEDTTEKQYACGNCSTWNDGVYTQVYHTREQLVTCSQERNVTRQAAKANS